MTEPTSLASWTRALRKQLDALGLDSAALCVQAGLDPLQMDDPNARYPLSATTRLWELAVQASGDPAIGLRVSRFVSPTSLSIKLLHRARVCSLPSASSAGQPPRGHG